MNRRGFLGGLLAAFSWRRSRGARAGAAAGVAWASSRWADLTAVAPKALTIVGVSVDGQLVRWPSGAVRVAMAPTDRPIAVAEEAAVRRGDVIRVRFLV